MKKYKCINLTTKEETLCEKVDEYYVSDERPEIGELCYSIRTKKIDIFGKFENSYENECSRVICSTNPNIDLPKVVDVVEEMADYYSLNLSSWSNLEHKEENKNHFKNGHLKSQSTHPNSDEDTKELLDWILMNDYEKIHGNRWVKKFHSKTVTSEELLQLFKDQQIKTVYYG